MRKLDDWEYRALIHKLEDLEIIGKAAPNDFVRNSDIEILIAICKRLLALAPVETDEC